MQGYKSRLKIVCASKSEREALVGWYDLSLREAVKKAKSYLGQGGLIAFRIISEDGEELVTGSTQRISYRW